MTFFKSRNLAVFVRLKTEISASCNCGHFRFLGIHPKSNLKNIVPSLIDK